MALGIQFNKIDECGDSELHGSPWVGMPEAPWMYEGFNKDSNH